MHGCEHRVFVHTQVTSHKENALRMAREVCAKGKEVAVGAFRVGGDKQQAGVSVAQ